MAAFKDRTGGIYGRLTVIRHAGRDHRKKHLWLCKCKCGNEKVVVGDNLSSGITLRQGVACINTNRKFVGIEIGRQEYNTSINRIEQAKQEATSETSI